MRTAGHSHRLVTIPPVGWVNAAHTHGVPALGTLITEWEAGAAACRQLFGTAAAAEAAAAQLARIAAHYGFDGWIVNIENEMELEHIPHLLHFLRVLTERMRQVAPACRHRVIWYDAVTTEGKLRWQNTLNSLNRPFFDACDAIWVNYTWRRGTPAAVRKEAGPRAADVYMGVDCFGRGTYGGGGFRCNTALRACLAQGLSAALFATAWPYEGDCGPSASPCWLERDALFWGRIERAWEALPLGGSASAAGMSSGSSSSAGGAVEGARSVQLVGVDLLVRGSCREEEGSPSFELHLGELCIEQAPLDAVQFTVQPEGCNGRVQCLQEAAHMTAVLQPPGNS
ncbi:glycoside isoform A [Chlorella sorokiniana]|uniref:Glycoside isoform A n=1 Tax=Chlorella sorokiniana TaxID=3076 RepID=A0A2P6TM35_CHLSO|nr:glycoside isoform A [Chlorella sorokiniana]|eukprot:PRW45396.1 glycoside isoform A [Chlorella sorokiniana]